MKVKTISYHDLKHALNPEKHQAIIEALLTKGLIGVTDVPDFEKKSRAYVDAAMTFSHLSDETKKQYAPNRDAGETEGYELGAEWFKNAKGEWQIDDKKMSYYAYYPELPRNVWPREVDLRTPYLELAELIFNTGKQLLKMLKLDDSIGIYDNDLVGHCRMLHYLKENDLTNQNPDWCGAHHDHSLLTGLMPAYYFQNGIQIPEPPEAGLYIYPYGTDQIEKVEADNSVLLFQIGEFGQLVSNDRVKATKHIVKKTLAGVERFAFALFYNLQLDYVATSQSVLTEDTRFTDYRCAEDKITYGEWSKAAYAKYRVM